ncbi:hypothetical protein Taro_007884, partial [Colocasia esculenta]|nr:hypothetical protein [Colocasia esculenta]
VRLLNSGRAEEAGRPSGSPDLWAAIAKFASSAWAEGRVLEVITQPQVSTEVDLRRKHGIVGRPHGSSRVDPPFLSFHSGKWGRPHVSNEVNLRRKHGHGKGTDQMTHLMNPTPSEESDDTSHHAVLSPEEAFRQVFGRDRTGRIRCGGRGQTLGSWYEPSEGSSSRNTAYLCLL